MKRFVLIAIAICTACRTPTPQASAENPKQETIGYPAEPSDPQRHRGSLRILIKDVKIMTAAGPIYDRGYVLIENGDIKAVGEGTPEALPNIDLELGLPGQVVTPGVIDTHSHMGVYPMPNVEAHEDGNEMSGPAKPEVWAEHSFWPQDPALWRALAGGVTTVQVLPGSGNLFGGRSFVAKLRPGISAREMRFPGAAQGLKIACGENPKRVHGDKGGPQTRMGNIARFRHKFQEALEYKVKQDEFNEKIKKWEQKPKSTRGTAPEPPTRDLGLETLVKVLRGEILVHNHCYRADEMHIMLDMAKEFGFKIRSFHHAVEAYKLRKRLAQENVAVSTWIDWWGFKMESFDGIPHNAAMLEDAGAKAIIHSDSSTDIQHLLKEAAKGIQAGKEIGLNITENQALRWVTANPAWALGIDKLVGTIEVGKMADLVIWNGNPFGIRALAQQVLVDGDVVYDRKNNVQRNSDFELGLFSGVKL